MKTQLIDGVAVLLPTTAEQLRDAVNSGQPFRCPDRLTQEFGLPLDAHVVDGEDAGVLEEPGQPD